MAETVRKSSIVCPRVAEMWMYAMAVLPFLGCAGRQDATENAGSGHPGNHSMEYSFTAGWGTHAWPAPGSPLAQAAIWLRSLNTSLVRMCCTWFSAVRSETYRVWPICLFVQSPREQPGHLDLARAQG